MICEGLGQHLRQDAYVTVCARNEGRGREPSALTLTNYIVNVELSLGDGCHCVLPS